MKDKEANNSFVELWGHTFKKINPGLSEAEVTSFVQQLMDERDKLLERQGHLTLLAELAERTVAEADNMANRIKEDAENQALADAEKRAQQIIEEKTTEAMTTVQKEIEAIKADTERQSAMLIEEKVEKLQADLRDTVQEMCRETLAQVENFRLGVTSFGASFEQKLLEHVEHHDQSSIKKESDISTDSEKVDENVAKVQVAEQADTGEAREEEPVPRTERKATNNEEWVVLEFLPPRDKDEIELIKTYLDSLPEVSTTELTTMVDNTRIEVSVNKQMNLPETIRAIPIVQEANEVVEGEQQKIQIILGLTSSIDETRNTLKSNFNNILSDGKEMSG